MKARPLMLLLALLASGCDSRSHEPRDQQIAVEPMTPVRVSAVTARPDVAAHGIPKAVPRGAASGELRRWRVYREYHFNQSSAMVRPTEVVKSIDIAAYAKQNPSARFRVDGFWDDQSEDLGRRRVQAVRNSLIDAGVLATRVEIGSLAERQIPDDRFVHVQLSD